MENVNYFNKEKIKYDLLSLEQIKELELFNKISIYAGCTDFAKKLGNKVSYKFEQNGTGRYFIKDRKNVRYAVLEDGRIEKVSEDDFGYGIRPVFKYTSYNDIFNKMYRTNEGLLVAEHGQFPQNIVSFNKNILLFTEYLTNNLRYNDKYMEILKYKKVKEIEEYSPFVCDYGLNYIYYYKYFLVVLHEYIKEGYIDEKYVKLFNTFFKVEPIKWILDEKSGLAISEKILVSNILASDVDYYLENIFSRDIANNGVKKLRR